MPLPKLADADFVSEFEALGPMEMARKYSLAPQNIYRRRANLEKKLKRQITAPAGHPNQTRFRVAHPKRLELDIDSGVVLVGSDGHYWPDEVSTAHRAFVHFARELRPKAVIMNGDAFDGASISRHLPISWTEQPTVQDEIEAVEDRLDEVVKAAPVKCRTIWTLGNHDARFETRLATVAPEFARVNGTSLKDHFPAWEPCWSVFVNDDVVVKHRFKGGIHAPHNNVMWAGKTMITGHLHSQKITPFSDYNGTRWGVDTGCLADPDAMAFDYTEDSPKNWRAGLAVLTFDKGRLLLPELVTVWGEDSVTFRGEVIRV